jgi:hypothetical protein
MYPALNRLDRMTALRLWTEANTWFSSEEGKKGKIKVGQLADLAMLSADYMTVAEEEIKDLASDLTLLGGNVVHAAGQFRDFAPPLPAVSPDWSPVNRFGGYYERPVTAAAQVSAATHVACSLTGLQSDPEPLSCDCWMG